MTNQLLQIFPNTSIFPVLGNHDEHPKDNFPAVNTTYYSDILSVCHWSEILGQVEAEQFKIGTLKSNVYHIWPVLILINKKAIGVLHRNTHVITFKFSV